MWGVEMFWFLCVVLFGGLWLGLFLGYRETEQRRLRERAEPEAGAQLAEAAMAALPRFFAKPNEVEARSAQPVIDDRLLADLERYVKAETALASQFVDAPSIASLYSPPSHSIHVN